MKEKNKAIEILDRVLVKVEKRYRFLESHHNPDIEDIRIDIENILDFFTQLNKNSSIKIFKQKQIIDMRQLVYTEEDVTSLLIIFKMLYESLFKMRSELDKRLS